MKTEIEEMIHRTIYISRETCMDVKTTNYICHMWIKI